jgi:fatty-acyl-CoA synthase
VRSDIACGVQVLFELISGIDWTHDHGASVQTESFLQRLDCALLCAPTMVTALVNYPDKQRFNLSSLRTIMVGGAASSATLVKQVEEKLGCTCISGYGLTETSPVLALSSIKSDISCDGEERFARQAMTGFAIPGVELRVVDDTGKDVPRDGAAMGEIVARGDAVMEGYWGQPAATRAVMPDGWFHTGDVATIDSHHYIHIVDRKKDIIVSGGENVSSLEVEKVLAAHTDVYEAVVIPVPDDKWGEVPKALVVLKAGVQVTQAELLEFCRSQLAHYKCPRSIEFVESLPKTGTGKILKRDLRKKYSTVQQGAGG